MKNLHAMIKEGPILSTPELDPEETNPQKIKEWKKMNKVTQGNTASFE